ncbi:MAG: N-methyl-L-tryptophan oxidase [Candidatus Binatia bacterium]
MKQYDCIVIGTGGIGSAALYYLAARNVKALGIDRWSAGHEYGSSHGATRIIRLAYFEHPNYVPLLRRAFTAWAEFGQRCGRDLYRQTGLLQVGFASGHVVPGVLRSAREHNLKVEQLSPSEVRNRFPGFTITEPMQAVFEYNAGYLPVEDCVRAYVSEAKKLGATIVNDESVHAWKTDGSGVTVTTDKRTYTAARVIIAPGAWASALLGDLGVSFTVRRKALFWYEAETHYRVDTGCPLFLYELPEGIFYGYPQIDSTGVKVGEHSGGQQVEDPLLVERSIDPQDRHTVENFLSTYLPGVSRTLHRHVVCLYTMSADGHFVVDVHPRSPNVIFAAGLSGHGFKFASVLGEILADLALAGKCQLPIEFLGLQRFR